MTPPTFFASGKAFHDWLARHHASETELLLGFHKKSSGLGGITYSEALDEALAFGWIDGVRKSLNDDSYTIRFTPRKPRSIWSAINVKRVKELEAAKRMMEPGRAAFAKRDDKRTAIYSYERDAAVFAPDELRRLKRDRAAWKYFSEEAPYYQRLCTNWVVSAKRLETRQRRLATLIECSHDGRRIPSQVLPAERKRSDRTA